MTTIDTYPACMSPPYFPTTVCITTNIVITPKFISDCAGQQKRPGPHCAVVFICERSLGSGQQQGIEVANQAMMLEIIGRQMGTLAHTLSCLYNAEQSHQCLEPEDGAVVYTPAMQLTVSPMFRHNTARSRSSTPHLTLIIFAGRWSLNFLIGDYVQTRLCVVHPERRDVDGQTMYYIYVPF